MKQRGKKKNELKEMRTISETSRTILNAIKKDSHLQQMDGPRNFHADEK